VVPPLGGVTTGGGGGGGGGFGFGSGFGVGFWPTPGAYAPSGPFWSSWVVVSVVDPQL
jgi:hypothetical protein